MKKILFIIIILIFCLNAAENTLATDFSNLYVFGDSLSDSGQLFLLDEPFRATHRVNPSDPVSPYADVWSQYFSRSMGFGELLPSTPVSRDTLGNNYAIVANRTDQILSSITESNGSNVFSLKTRDGYLIQNPQADSHAFYVIWGGGNDVRDARDNPAKDTQTAADNIVKGVQVLHAAGARYILVPIMVNIGDIPESAYLNLTAEGESASQRFNEELFEGIKTSGANVILADVNTFFKEILGNATAFGFSSEDQQVVAFDGSNMFTGIPAAEGINGAHSSSPDPSQYVFFDGIHPTTNTHRMIAQYFESILVGPELVSILAEVPLSMTRQHDQQLASFLQTSDDFFQSKNFVSFFQGGYTDVDVDDSHRTPGFNDSQYNFSVGGTYGFSPYCYGGIALGVGFADVDFQGSYGGFNLKGGFISFFTGYRKTAFSVDGMATVGKLEYDDVNRKVFLGPVLRIHTGDTSGGYWALNLSVGYHILDWENFTIGPEAEVFYQEVHVDAYHEEGSLSSAMSFGEQARYRLSGNLGFGFNWLLESAKFRGKIAYEKADDHDPRYINAALNTLPSYSFKLEGFNPAIEFWVFDAGSNVRLSNKWVAMVSLNVRLGEGDTEKSGYVGVRYRF